MLNELFDLTEGENPTETLIELAKVYCLHYAEYYENTYGFDNNHHALNLLGTHIHKAINHELHSVAETMRKKIRAQKTLLTVIGRDEAPTIKDLFTDITDNFDANSSLHDFNDDLSRELTVLNARREVLVRDQRLLDEILTELDFDLPPLEDALAL